MYNSWDMYAVVQWIMAAVEIELNCESHSAVVRRAEGVGVTQTRASFYWIRICVLCFCGALVWCAAARGQDEQKKAWQPGTMLQVKAHEPESNADTGEQYDVSIKVGGRIYRALYTQKKEDPDLKDYVGMSRMVLIEEETLKFNDLLGHTHSLRILDYKDAPDQEHD